MLESEKSTDPFKRPLIFSLCAIIACIALALAVTYVIVSSIQHGAKVLAVSISTMCPDSREKSLALTKLEEAVMWANASIAQNE